MKHILILSVMAFSFCAKADDPLLLKPDYSFRVHKSPVLKIGPTGKRICAGILRRVKIVKGKDDLFDGDVAVGCDPIIVKNNPICPEALECKDAAFEMRKPFENKEAGQGINNNSGAKTK
jgi:hypothetical protein